jgi:hypothetical protein
VAQLLAPASVQALYAIAKGLSRPRLSRFILGANMVPRSIKWILLASIACYSPVARAQCFNSVQDLKANHVKTRWHETTENDGKPLMIAIADGANGLAYTARKAGQLWLSGNVSVCRTGGANQITLKNTKATSNVPMLARMALPSSQSATIVNDQIKLSGGGWGGTFVGR